MALAAFPSAATRQPTAQPSAPPLARRRAPPRSSACPTSGRAAPPIWNACSAAPHTPSRPSCAQTCAHWWREGRQVGVVRLEARPAQPWGGPATYEHSSAGQSRRSTAATHERRGIHSFPQTTLQWWLGQSNGQPGRSGLGRVDCAQQLGNQLAGWARQLECRSPTQLQRNRTCGTSPPPTRTPRAKPSRLAARRPST